MSIYTFVSQTELDDLPHEPRQAFGDLIHIAQRKLGSLVEALDGENQSDWNRIEELNYAFMNVVIAASKRFEVDPFMSMQVPQFSEFKNHQFFQFKSDVDHYVTQLALDNSFRNRRNSVEIPAKSKDNIRSYLHGLKDCVEKASITDKKRDALLKHLAHFETELERRRLNLVEVSMLTLTVMALPGGAWASADLTIKLVHNIAEIIAEAKEAEDERPALTSGDNNSAPKALSAPRPAAPVRPPFDDDLEDDVPF